jgi:RNA polymerase sigma-70 factor (ECF subfamily)
MTAADAIEWRTLPRVARSASIAQAAQGGQQRFARTASNLSPAAPLHGAEEDTQRMVGALAVTEVALIARAQAGDHAAFETIFTQYQTQIYNYIYRLMGSAEDAYDMTQDTFLKAYLALPKTSDDLRVGAWLYRIATNVCLDELRHRKLLKWQPWESFVSLFHPSQIARDNPERDAMQAETKSEVEVVLEKLSERYRVALVLREYHGLGYEDIAEIMGTTRTAVKTLLLRAREAFRFHYVKLHPQLAAEARGPRVLPRAMGRGQVVAAVAAVA